MKVYFTALIIIFQLSVYLLPTSLSCMNDEELVEIQGTSIPRHFLTKLLEAQRVAYGLRACDFNRRASGKTDWSADERSFFKDTVIKFELLSWALKARLDKTLGKHEQSLAHTCPVFDQTRHPQGEEPFHSTLCEPESTIIIKRHTVAFKEFEDLCMTYATPHELAYRSVYYYIETLLKYLFSPTYPQEFEQTSTDLSIARLATLYSDCFRQQKELRLAAEPSLKTFGFSSTYGHKDIYALPSFHISDQNTASFRAGKRAYRISKNISDEHRRQNIVWLQLKIARLQSPPSFSSESLSALLEELSTKGFLAKIIEVNQCPQILLEGTQSPFMDFSDWLTRGFSFIPQEIPVHQSSLDEALEYLKIIWPEGLPKTEKEQKRFREPTSVALLKLFLEIMEKRTNISIQTNLSFLPDELTAMTRDTLVRPQKNYGIRPNPAMKYTIQTSKVDITLTTNKSVCRTFSMSEFVSLWNNLPILVRQLLVTLQAIEYIFTQIDNAAYKIYVRQIKRAYELCFPEPTEPLMRLEQVWQSEGRQIQQSNVDQTHMFLHTICPELQLPNILDMIRKIPGAYESVTSHLSYSCDPNMFESFQRKRELVVKMVRVFRSRSQLVFIPTPETAIAPNSNDPSPRGKHSKKKEKPTLTPLERIMKNDADRRADEARRAAAQKQKKTAQAERKAAEEDARQKKEEALKIAEEQAILEKIQRAQLATWGKETSDEFPQIGWAATLFYSSHQPMSWADWDDFPEEVEFINTYFSAFYRWYSAFFQDLAKNLKPAVPDNYKVKL